MRIIRPSALPSANNCMLSTAAGLFPEDFALAGYEVPRLPSAAGAAVGTTAHAIVADMFLKKRDEGGAPQVEDYQRAIEEKFIEKINTEGIEWDATTKDEKVAIRQITSQVGVYRAYILPGIKPKLIEHKLRAELEPGIVVEGTLDLQDIDDVIHDAKFGARFKHHGAQLGAYAMLVEAHKGKVAGIQEEWIKRKGGAPAEPIITRYDLEANKTQAKLTIKRIARDINRFQASGDPGEFVANPHAMTCTPKYCPVYGTNLCNQWQAKPLKED